MNKETASWKEKIASMERNTPLEYVVIRTEIVYVKKRFGLFFTEHQLGFNIVIPDTPKQAAEFMGKILAESEKYGKGFDVKDH